MKPSIAIAVLLTSSLLWAQTSATTQEQKPVSVATICIYRPHRFEGYSLKPSVYIDQVEVARLHNGESVQVTVSAGQHRVNSNDKSTGIDLDAKAGQTYYMRVDIKTGAWKGHGAITLIDAQEGKYEFSQQKLAPTRDLTSNQATATSEETNRTAPSTPATAPPKAVPASASEETSRTAPSAPATAPPTAPATAPSTAVAASAVEDAATVSVSTIPDGAEIYADGTFVGNAPAKLRLPAGKHTIRVTQPDYKDWSREIAVQAGSEARIIATLEKK